MSTPLQTSARAAPRTQASARRDAGALDRGTMIVASVVLLGAVMSILDTTVINVAINRLALDFNAPLTTIQWVVTGYTLALAAVIPITGWAADRFGTKRIYLTSLALFMLGSILCAFAWSAGSLIAFRVLQGAGGGMIMPSAMTILTKKAGPHRMGRVMGILGVPMLVAPILGPILGGWLVDDVSWRWIFLINVPIGIAAIVLATMVLKRDQPQPTSKLDWVGMALLSPGLTFLIFGLAESNGTDGFAAPRSWLPIVAGAALIIGFLRHSMKAKEPLIDIRTFTHTRAGAAAGTLMLFAIAFFGALLLIPLYYQIGSRRVGAARRALLRGPTGARLDDHDADRRQALRSLRVDRLGGVRDPAARARDGPVRVRSPPPPPTCCSAARASCSASGMGLAMMPTMTAAMQAVPTAAIARTIDRDEHHPPVRRLDRDGGALGDPARSGDQRPACPLTAARCPPARAAGSSALRALSSGGSRREPPIRWPTSFAHTFVWAAGPARAGLHPGAGDGARPAQAPRRRPRGRGNVGCRARVDPRLALQDHMDHD